MTEFPATHMVYWPSKDVPMCERHREEARKVSPALGLGMVHSAPLDPGQECVTCIHEAKEKDVSGKNPWDDPETAKIIIEALNQKKEVPDEL
jgi:hypothetical protein